jgi:hypothetical protein
VGNITGDGDMDGSGREWRQVGRFLRIPSSFAFSLFVFWLFVFLLGRDFLSKMKIYSFHRRELAANFVG